jgi:hypothetical protein
MALSTVSSTAAAVSTASRISTSRAVPSSPPRAPQHPYSRSWRWPCVLPTISGRSRRSPSPDRTAAPIDERCVGVPRSKWDRWTIVCKSRRSAGTRSPAKYRRRLGEARRPMRAFACRGHPRRSSGRSPRRTRRASTRSRRVKARRARRCAWNGSRLRRCRPRSADRARLPPGLARSEPREIPRAAPAPGLSARRRRAARSAGTARRPSVHRLDSPG